MLIEKEPGTDWRDLQERVAAILGECGLAAETGRVLATARGTVEIDVYATDPAATPPAIYLSECKRWASNVPQSEVQAFRTTVADAGAHFGLFISARGFQSGAYDVVRHTNVHLLSWTQFQELFLERWCRRHWIPTFRSAGGPLATYVEPVGSDAAIRERAGEPIEPAEAVGLFALDMWGAPFDGLAEIILGRSEPVAAAILEGRDRYRDCLPAAVADAECFRDLLDALVVFAKDWQHDRETPRPARDAVLQNVDALERHLLPAFSKGEIVRDYDLNRVLQAINLLQARLGLAVTEFPIFRQGQIVSAGSINNLVQPISEIHKALGMPGSWQHHPVRPGELYTEAHFNELYGKVKEAIRKVRSS